MLYPPRPEAAVDSSELFRYENLGWIGQFKKNGTYGLADTVVDTNYTRHLEPHKNWDPSSSLAMVEIRKIKGLVLCGEVLHKKVKGGHQDTMYLHDILIYKREDLTGTSYQERYNIITNLFDIKDEGDNSHFVVNKNLWVAKNHKSGFKRIWDAINDLEDEGLVLKNPAARLKFGSKPSSNSSWQIKCRYPHKNYSF